MSTRTRKNAETRADEIVCAGLRIAEQVGYANVTREQIADELGVSKALITKYFKMENLRERIIKLAVEVESLSVIAEGILAGEETAKNIPSKLKTKVVRACF